MSFENKCSFSAVSYGETCWCNEGLGGKTKLSFFILFKSYRFYVYFFMQESVLTHIFKLLQLIEISHFTVIRTTSRFFHVWLKHESIVANRVAIIKLKIKIMVAVKIKHFY